MAKKTKVEKKAPTPKSSTISVEQVCADLALGEAVGIDVRVIMSKPMRRGGFTDRFGVYTEFEAGDVVASFAGTAGGVKVKL